MSHENERPGLPGQSANTNILSTSNATSEHFLGSTRRQWMLGQRGATGVRIPNQNVTGRNISRSTTYTRPVSVQHGPIPQVGPPLSTTDLGGGLHSSADQQTQPASDARLRSQVPSADINAFSMQNNNAIQLTETFNSNSDAIHGTVQPSLDESGTLNTEGFALSPSMLISPPLPQVATGNGNRLVSMSAIERTRPAQHSTSPQQGSQFQASSERIMFQSSNQPSTNNFSPTTGVPPSTAPAITLSNPLSHLTPAKRPRDQPNVRQAGVMSPPQTPTINQTHPVGFPTSVQPIGVTLPTFELILDRRIAPAAAKKPPNAVEMIRLTWLRGACQHGDMFYLFLHQLSCIHTVHPQFLASRLGFSLNQMSGLVLLNQVLADNKDVTPDMMLVFCSFIVPLNGFEVDANVRQRLPKAQAFLEQFRVRWEALRNKVFTRGTPPYAYELAMALGADSHILAQALYTNFFYSLFPRPSKSFTEDGFTLFKHTQTYFFHRMSEGFRWTPQDFKRELQAFMTKFHEIARRHGQRPMTAFAPLQREPNQPPNALPVPNTQAPFSNQMQNPGRHNVTQASTMTSSQPASQTAPAVPHVSQLTQQGTAEAQQNKTTPLFPPDGFVLPTSREPDPSRSALHQAQLQYPAIAVRNAAPTFGKIPRFYSFFECFIGNPKFIDKDTVFEQWSVTIPPNVFSRRALDIPIPKEDPLRRPNRFVENGSVIFHLRCIEVNAASESLDASEYSSTKTTWPEHLFISINGRHVDFRRKVHFGRDLPVDVTALVQQEANKIELSYLLNKDNQKEATRTFAIALEANNILEHDKALDLPGQLDAGTSLAAITSLLRTPQDSNDDDISLINAYVSIDLIDPNTLRIFDQPVRGRTCEHRECFDLETFLQERPIRHKDGLVQPDEWICQLCRKDARPGSLIVDEFLLQVKQKLIADGKGDARAILVKEDGSWEPKMDNSRVLNAGNRKGSNEPRLARSASATDAKAASGTTKEPDIAPFPLDADEPEVIVLDDDE